MGVLRQVISTVIICFSSMNLGIIYTWPSSTIILFKSANTTLQRPMTDIEIALFGSLPTLSTIVTMPFLVGNIINKLGRKHTVMLIALLIVIAWTIIALSNRVEAILAACVITGCGCSMCLASIIYIGEIAQNSIRGILTTAPNLFCSFGFLLSYGLGGYLEYHTNVYTCLSLAVIGVLMIAVLKESPVSLMMMRREQEAAKSVAFYRSVSITSKEVMTELNNIRLTLHSDTEDSTLMLVEKKTVIKALKSKNISCWQIFKTTQAVRRQFYLGIVLNTSVVCHGLMIIQSYAEPIFLEILGDAISPNICSMVLGLVVLIAGALAAFLVDKVGRRPLQLLSSVFSGICCALLGVQIVTEWLPKWTVPLIICIFATSYTLGSGTVPFVISAEIFLPEVKSVLLTVMTTWMAGCQFILSFVFNMLLPRIGLSPFFFFFSFACFSSSVYFFYFLPETKGMPIYTIQSLFMKKVEKRLFILIILYFTDIIFEINFLIFLFSITQVIF